MSQAELEAPAEDPTEPTPALDEDDLAMLELERSWWRFPAVKETMIREQFGISSTIYYARLHRLIERPEALSVDPMTVRRLQRLRDQRRAQRSSRRLA